MTTTHGSSRNGERNQCYELVFERVRLFQRGRKWYANFQHRGRQRRQSLGTTSKKEARRRALVLESKLAAGEYQQPKRAPSLADVIEQYRVHLKTERRRPKTVKKYEHGFKRMLELAKQRRTKTILDIDLSFVDAFRQGRTRGNTDKPASAKTIHNDTVLLKQLVNFALRRGLIHEDPLRGLKLKKPKITPQPCWTRPEVDRILAATREPQRSSLTILAETGMRAGELKHLTWEDVDFERGVLHIRPKDDWQPKTGDIRAIPISPALRELLGRLPRRTRWVVTARASRRYPDGDHQISERRLLDYLKRVLKRLGLKGHLHTFRHAFISHALTSGVPEAIVRQWVGHVDPAIIRQYTHIADVSSQAAMQRLAEGGTGILQPSHREVKSNERAGSKSAQIQHSPRPAKTRGRAK
jgi:integrase